MPVTHDELDQFHRFASERLQSQAADCLFDDLVAQWRSNRQATNDARTEAFEQMDAGLEMPLAEAMDDIRKWLGLAES